MKKLQRMTKAAFALIVAVVTVLGEVPTNWVHTDASAAEADFDVMASLDMACMSLLVYCFYKTV